MLFPLLFPGNKLYFHHKTSICRGKQAFRLLALSFLGGNPLCSHLPSSSFFSLLFHSWYCWSVMSITTGEVEICATHVGGNTLQIWHSCMAVFFKLITLQKCRSIHVILIYWTNGKVIVVLDFWLLSYFVLVISCMSVEFPVLIPVQRLDI